MYIQNDYLENRLKDSRQLDFKSAGERQIAYFLKDNSIRYRYEPGVLVEGPNRKQRIWYPDFYLPEFKSYIEYYGIKGDPAIRQRHQGQVIRLSANGIGCHCDLSLDAEGRLARAI